MCRGKVSDFRARTPKDLFSGSSQEVGLVLEALAGVRLLTAGRGRRGTVSDFRARTPED